MEIKTRIRHFRVDDELDRVIERLAELRGESESTVIRDAIRLAAKKLPPTAFTPQPALVEHFDEVRDVVTSS